MDEMVKEVLQEMKFEQRGRQENMGRRGLQTEEGAGAKSKGENVQTRNSREASLEDEDGRQVKEEAGLALPGFPGRDKVLQVVEGLWILSKVGWQPLNGSGQKSDVV